ncbi:E3 ubiquitin-protein ligase MARCHF3 isoform X3 [Caloenas nicobarica]
MRTSRCSHLPGVPPERPPALNSKALPAGTGSCPRYVMQVSTKDGQLLSSVVRTLATQRPGVVVQIIITISGAQLRQVWNFPDAFRDFLKRLLHWNVKRREIQSSPFNDWAICRICHEGSSQEDLLSPCECTGTLGTIHRSCLEHWLSSSNTSYCELCHFRFAVERKPRPLVEWLRNPGPQHEKRTLFGDMVCFLFITPLATISGWLCLRGAVDHLHFSSRLEAVGLIALTVALFTIYLFWTLVSFRYHCRLYNEWRRTNQRVILLAPKSANIPSSHQSLLGLQYLKRNSKETIV